MLGTLVDGPIAAPRIELSEILYASGHPQQCRTWDAAIQYCHGCRAQCRGKDVYVRHFIAHDARTEAEEKRSQTLLNAVPPLVDPSSTSPLDSHSLTAPLLSSLRVRSQSKRIWCTLM